ncbi:thioredoxin family protein [Rhodobacter ferrooxidans]|uniref:Thioredoxin domain-containing protein n=1 Tax=Rhodobacter ferrooxidans TaxID=371731 RepID=C8S2Y7_9RHOB|nr:thioredoxin family protein [Rhodobacter sp. SW2]EEW24627.1 hypothetical protein Rsw2DRAFT_2415 [Rhodobacter sp. SW2]
MTQARKPVYHQDPGGHDTCGPGGCGGSLTVPGSFVLQANNAFKYILNLPIAVWGTDFEAALAQAKQTGGIVMADFSATNCWHCQLLRKTVFDTPYFTFWVQMRSAVRPIILFRHEIANFGLPDALCKKCDVGVQGGTGFPSVIGLNADGSERGRQVGFGNDTLMWQWLAGFESAAALDQSP